MLPSSAHGGVTGGRVGSGVTRGVGATDGAVWPRCRGGHPRRSLGGRTRPGLGRERGPLRFRRGLDRGRAEMLRARRHATRPTGCEQHGHRAHACHPGSHCPPPGTPPGRDGQLPGRFGLKALRAGAAILCGETLLPSGVLRQWRWSRSWASGASRVQRPGPGRLGLAGAGRARLRGDVAVALPWSGDRLSEMLLRCPPQGTSPDSGTYRTAAREPGRAP